jgi:hypothetical protein
VVKRLSRVMIIIWGSAFFPFTYINPSAPAPPDLLMTTTGFGERLYFEMSGEMNLAITSAPPPAPAGTTNSMGLAGCQAAWAPPIDRKDNVKQRAKTTRILMAYPPFSGMII